MKYLLVILLCFALLFGCTQEKPIQSDSNEIKVVDNETLDQNVPLQDEPQQVISDAPVIDSNVNDGGASQEFLDSICYNDTNFFDYSQVRKVSELVNLSKESDFNKSGLCLTNYCGAYMQAMVTLENDILTVETTTYFDLKNSEPVRISLLEPTTSTDSNILVNDKIQLIRKEKSDYSISNFQSGDDLNFFNAAFTYDFKKGRNIIKEKYSYPAQKSCIDNVCVYVIPILAFDNEAVEFTIRSDKTIVSEYQKQFIGANNQIIATTDEPVFKVGSLTFAESQKKYYTANKTRVDWVSNHIDYAENIVNQKAPKEMFVYFTNSIRSENSFTYGQTNLIVMQGNYFDDYFEETLLHEINHQAVSNPYWPDWLHEGIANYVSSNYIGREIPDLTNDNYIVTENKINYYLVSNSRDEYDYASNIVRDIIKKHGCGKFKDFLYQLNSLDNRYNKEKMRMETAIKKVFGDYTYADLINRKV